MEISEEMHVDPSSSGHFLREDEELQTSPNLQGLTFKCREEAWEFYKEYAKQIGFSARRATTRHDANGNVRKQEFCCSKAGFSKSSIEQHVRQRAPRAETRTGCQAKVCVSLIDIDMWHFCYCHTEHNHPLCPVGLSPFLRSNRHVMDADLIEARALTNVGVRPSQVMQYFCQQAGSFHNVGFIRKDLHNSLQATAGAEIVDGDVNDVLAYFECKKDIDLGFYMKYSLDEANALQNIFWCDSTSRSDYACFGDVIAFDTTYKGNAYGRPLMPIVGVNHHHQTIVFGVAILADETAETFEWVLQTYLEAMFNKAPISVVTDSDRAMQRAIKTVIPFARHRLCAWHLARNAQANIGDNKFTQAFSRCMSSWWTVEEFDLQWRALVQKFNVESHPWVVEKDRTTHMWAQAYLTEFPAMSDQPRQIK
ncbi:hypothetical protein GQ457_04G026770 [Hibiscus cannabinus]